MSYEQTQNMDHAEAITALYRLTDAVTDGTLTDAERAIKAFDSIIALATEYRQDASCVFVARQRGAQQKAEPPFPLTEATV